MEHQSTSGMSWSRFVLMIAVSTVAMFLLMYQLVYSADHVMFSLNRLLASVVMAAVMTVVMLGFMWKMYEGQSLKVAVMVAAILIGSVLLLVNRSQFLVDDTLFMRAMIPHHSIAINNAEMARLTDPRVRRLADQIIAAQVKEIEEMKLLIDDIDRNGTRGDTPLEPKVPIVTPDMSGEISRAIE